MTSIGFTVCSRPVALDGIEGTDVGGSPASTTDDPMRLSGQPGAAGLPAQPHGVTDGTSNTIMFGEAVRLHALLPPVNDDYRAGSRGPVQSSDALLKFDGVPGESPLGK